jgi:hypothetical protein
VVASFVLGFGPSLDALLRKMLSNKDIIAEVIGILLTYVAYKLKQLVCLRRYQHPLYQAVSKKTFLYQKIIAGSNLD